MPMPGPLAVRGLGLCLPGVAGPADLAAQLAGRVAPPRVERRFEAPGTDLGPVDRWTYGPAEPRMPAGVPARGLRSLPHESLLALACAATARRESGAGPAPDPDPMAVLWASSSAGLAEYAAICTDAALLDPGLTSPIIAPASAFNGPAATVSIRLGLTGPNETLSGGSTAGISALVEAGRILGTDDATHALVGASATVSRWSLPGLSEGAVPAEGAVCLVVEPWSREGPAGAAAGLDGSFRPGTPIDDGVRVRVGPWRRVGLDPARLVPQVRELLNTSAPDPAAILVSAADPAPEPAGPVDGTDGVPFARGLVGALATERSCPVWHVERRLGDYGAAGGLLAVAGAVAYCLTAESPATLLAVAVEASGNASLVEVSS